MNNRNGQKCRILRKDYDAFIRFILRSLSNEDIEFIRAGMKRILNEQKDTDEKTSY